MQAVAIGCAKQYVIENNKETINMQTNIIAMRINGNLFMVTFALDKITYFNDCPVLASYPKKTIEK